MFALIRIAILVILGIIIFRVISNLFSDKKTCPRCEGKGWWQNTRNRETCEWCHGEGRISKDFPV